MLVLTPGRPPGGEGSLLGIVRDTKWGRSSALEQSLVLESAKRVLAKAEVRRTVVAWPGALSAVLIDWTQEQEDASGERRKVRTVQLAVDVNDRVSLSVVAVAPLEVFDESGVATALRTFRPDRTAS